MSELNGQSKGGNDWQLSRIVGELHAARSHWRETHGRFREFSGRELPSRSVMASVIESLSGALFPLRLGPDQLRQESEDFYVGFELERALNALVIQAKLELDYFAKQRGENGVNRTEEAQRLVQAFALALPELRRLLDTDVIAAYQGDPAARSVDEVLLCYPGIYAMIHHRIAHHFYSSGLPLLARMVSERAHSATGIDIHPGAQIGEGFFIDHGTGVVIGETCIIGDRVRIYQAVTLGAKRFPADAEGNLKKGHPRHPIVEDDVVIYAGATILGRITIGQGSTIGGNVWLTHGVPANSNVSQASLQGCAGLAQE